MVLDHTARLADGTHVRLDEAYAGRVVLVVNTASRCGFTPQFEGLQELHETYGDRGLSVLAFPTNDFNQDPGSTDEIVSFCRTEFGVTFSVFEKIKVRGDDAHPLYADLGSQPEPIGGAPKWNFTKFLIGRDGNVIGRFESRDSPTGEAMTGAIEAALAETASTPAG
ncbi:MAG: glutathione peroxidase [Planctomycetota bacterium]